MSNNIKNGKKPLSAKTTNILKEDDLFGNQMSIPADVQAELDAQGLEGHWIKADTVYAHGGYHKRGWVPYKRKKIESGTMTNSEFILGRDPEGYIRRGDLILGVKTKEQVQQHKAYLAQKANRGKDIQKEKAAELRQLAKDARLDSVKIHEGYEENED